MSLHGIGSADLRERECADELNDHNPAMSEDLPEVGGCLTALMSRQICGAAHIDRIESGVWSPALPGPLLPSLAPDS
jgi:hypothetical protein